MHIAGLSSLVSQHKYPVDQGFSNCIAGVALNEFNILYYLNNKLEFDWPREEITETTLPAMLPIDKYMWLMVYLIFQKFIHFLISIFLLRLLPVNNGTK
jgi:hypothetical protein